MTTTMVSIWGSRSVPAGTDGSGRSPGCRTLVRRAGGGDAATVVDVDESGDEHAPRPTAAAPASAPPRSARREMPPGRVMPRTVPTAGVADNRPGGSVPAMEFADAVRRRHMTRNFEDTALAPDLLHDLLALALTAPSAGNTQGRDLVVLEGPERTARYWAATTDAAWRARSRRYAGMARAPVVVLAFSDPEAYVARYTEPDKVRPDGGVVDWVVPYWHVDAAYSVMTLLLGAADRGVGAAFLGNFRGEGALKDDLGVPERMCWLGAVLLGRPARPDPPSSSASRERRSVADSVHVGRW